MGIVHPSWEYVAPFLSNLAYPKLGITTYMEIMISAPKPLTSARQKGKTVSQERGVTLP